MREQKPPPRIPDKHPYREPASVQHEEVSVDMLVDRLIKYAFPYIFYKRLDTDPNILCFDYKNKLVAKIEFCSSSPVRLLNVKLFLYSDDDINTWFEWEVPKNEWNRLHDLLQKIKTKYRQNILNNTYKKLQ
jgi:hypothetical protein